MRVNLLLPLALAMVGIVAFTGCGRSNRVKEPPITGRRADPAMQLRAEWKPGYRYHLRADLTVNTDSEASPGDDDLHSVILGQEYAVVVANVYTNGNRKLELQILSIEMQRSKGPQFALMYDSTMKGEVIDDNGFVPALDALIGGKVRCTVTPDGKVTRVEGVSALMNRAGVSSSSGAKTVRRLVDGIMVTNTIAPPTNRPVIRRSATASAVRNLFNTDFFKQLVEFNYLPPSAVKIGDSWKTQREFYLNSTVGRLSAEATTLFKGWQKQRQQDVITNCVRLEMSAELKPQPRPAAPRGGTNAPPGAPPPPPPSSPFEEGVLHGLIWLNPEMEFPIARRFDQTVSYISGRGTVVRIEGTNRIMQRFAKNLEQSMSIRLIDLKPLPGTAAPTQTLEKDGESN
jgi:hypothetical protein